MSDQIRVEVPNLTLVEYWILLYVGSKRDRREPRYVTLMEIAGAAFVEFDGEDVFRPIDTAVDRLGAVVPVEIKGVDARGKPASRMDNRGGFGLMRMAENQKFHAVNNTAELTPDGWRQLAFQRKRVLRDAKRDIDRCEVDAKSAEAPAPGHRADPGGANDFRRQGKILELWLAKVTALVEPVLAAAPLANSEREQAERMPDSPSEPIRETDVLTPEDVGVVRVPVIAGKDGMGDLAGDAKELDPAQNVPMEGPRRRR